MKKNYFQLCLFLLVLSSFNKLSSQQTYTFTNAGATGRFGPTQSQLNAAYLSTNLSGSVVSSSGVQLFTVTPGIYRIAAFGAQGGTSTLSTGTGGLGARMQGDFTITSTSTLNILVGQQGEIIGYNTGGGGGTFVWITGQALPLIVAGGGGGSGYSSSGVGGATTTAGTAGVGSSGTAGSGGSGANPGGGGWLSAGANFQGASCTPKCSGNTAGLTVGGASPTTAIVYHGCAGTDQTGDGGFGGGSGGNGNCTTSYGGGGGGGYSGGVGQSGATSGGGGGGSYNAGSSQTNTAAFNSGHGKVIITELCSVKISSSSSGSVSPAVLCSGNSLTLTTDAVSNYSWSTGATTNSIVVSPTTNTFYTVVGTSSMNCTATGVMSVIVSSGSPVLSISNPSSNICLGKTVSLTATGAITYTWTNAGVVNGQTFTPTSSAVYTVTGQNGCGTTVATTTITITPLSVSASVSPTIVCQGYPATLTAVAAVNGFTWQPNVFANSSTVSVNPYANTIYTVTASDGTCAGTATVALATKTTPTITATASNTQICEGDNTVINATGATSYEWSPGNLSGSTHTVSPTTSTLYVVTGTNNVGCYSSANVVVLVYPHPTVTAISNNTLVCQGGTAVLSAGGASTYVWTNGPPSNSYTVNPQNTDTYTVTGTDQYGCVNTQTVSVWVYLPVMNVSATPTAVCTGSSVSLSASTPSGSGYTWNGTPGQNVQLTPAATTVYIVTATSASNNVSCPATNSIQVVVNPNPNVTATASKTVMCKGDAAAVITGSGAATYTWNTAATTATIAASNLGSNTYTVNATDANGCKGKASIFIQVNQCVGISETTANATQVLIYPNPTSGEFAVTGERSMKLSIMNETGQLVKIAELNADNHYSATVSSLPAGLYLIVSESKVVGKVIITK